MKFLKTKKYSILSNILKYSFVVVFAFMLIMPVVFAQDGGGTNTPNGGGANTPDGGGMNITTTINNPLGTGGPQTIPDFIKAIVNIVLVVGIPIIALAIIYTGFLFVQAQGNSEKLTKAKNALLYTLIGGALLLGAFVIANAIGTTVDNIKKGA
jgi:hypothetical protein